MVNTGNKAVEHNKPIWTQKYCHNLGSSELRMMVTATSMVCVRSLYNVIGNDENVFKQTFIIYNVAPEPF